MPESRERDRILEDHYGVAAKEFLVTQDKLHIPHLDPDSHKGQNGRICVIGGSDLFHGAGEFAALGAIQVVIRFAGEVDDGVYYCSTPENVKALKELTPSFIGIHREEIEDYSAFTDVFVVGPGLMREPQEERPSSLREPEFTQTVTKRILAIGKQTGKKVVLDAGSLQVIEPEQLRGHNEVIITPHRGEMATLFHIDPETISTSHSSTFGDIKSVAGRVQLLAKEYGITILLKGPVDIIAGPHRWLFSPGGNAALTKGGTGDVLAGIAGALYPHIQDPVLTAATASFIVKRTAEDLASIYKTMFGAQRLVENIGLQVDALLKETVKIMS